MDDDRGQVYHNTDIEEYLNQLETEQALMRIVNILNQTAMTPEEFARAALAFVPGLRETIENTASELQQILDEYDIHDGIPVFEDDVDSDD